MMKSTLRAPYLVALALSSSLGLAACSMNSAAPLLPARSPLQPAARVSPDTFGSWVYTCDISTALCLTYTLAGTTPTLDQTLQFSGNPSGQFATTPGKWYVAERTASAAAVYKSTLTGPTGPTETLSDTGDSPSDVTVNVAHGIVAIANLYNEHDGSNTVTVYAGGAKAPTRKLHFVPPGGKGGYGIGVATDSSGDCFFSVDDAGLIKFDIVKYTGCNGTGSIVFTSAADTSAGGLAFDGSNNLYFVDNSFEQIYRCTGTTNCKVIASGFQNITFIRFDKGWKHLWTTDKNASKLYALNPLTGHKVSTTTESVGMTSLSIAPGPTY